jgi:EAL domain-containing protein (putative c-di-GMP-specific phosphodiesterase class I)
LRSTEATLPHPGAILAAAEKLGRVHELGRAIRKAVAGAAADMPAKQLFVNLHTIDLNDEDLFSAEAPLSKFASNVVLEITERASLDEVADVQVRVNGLPPRLG